MSPGWQQGVGGMGGAKKEADNGLISKGGRVVKGINTPLVLTMPLFSRLRFSRAIASATPPPHKVQAHTSLSRQLLIRTLDPSTCGCSCATLSSLPTTSAANT